MIIIGRDDHALGGLADVAAERKRELVEQQILRHEVRILGQAIEDRTVAVHVFVQAFHEAIALLSVDEADLHYEMRSDSFVVLGLTYNF